MDIGENVPNQSSNQTTQTNQSSTTQSSPTAGTPSATPEKNTLMSVLAYIGPLVIVSYVTAKDDPFVKFHIKQGLVLFVIEIIIMVLGNMMYGLYPILMIVNWVMIAFSVIGIVNAVQGNEKELPLIGHLSKHFKI